MKSPDSTPPTRSNEESPSKKKSDTLSKNQDELHEDNENHSITTRILFLLGGTAQIQQRLGPCIINQTIDEEKNPVLSIEYQDKHNQSKPRIFRVTYDRVLQLYWVEFWEKAKNKFRQIASYVGIYPEGVKDLLFNS